MNKLQISNNVGNFFLKILATIFQDSWKQRVSISSCQWVKQTGIYMIKTFLRYRRREKTKAKILGVIKNIKT